MEHGRDQHESDDEKFKRFGLLLARELDAAIGPWVLAVIESKVPRSQRGEDFVQSSVSLSETVRAEAVEAVRSLVSEDIDDQGETPLGIVRNSARRITSYLEELGIPQTERDPFDVRASPSDIYAIGPTSWVDLGEEVSAAAISWGAAKAYVHLKRHKE